MSKGNPPRKKKNKKESLTNHPRTNAFREQHVKRQTTRLFPLVKHDFRVRWKPNAQFKQQNHTLTNTHTRMNYRFLTRERFVREQRWNGVGRVRKTRTDLYSLCKINNKQNKSENNKKINTVVVKIDFFC